MRNGPSKLTTPEISWINEDIINGAILYLNENEVRIEDLANGSWGLRGTYYNAKVSVLTEFISQNSLSIDVKVLLDAIERKEETTAKNIKEKTKTDAGKVLDREIKMINEDDNPLAERWEMNEVELTTEANNMRENFENDYNKIVWIDSSPGWKLPEDNEVIFHFENKKWIKFTITFNEARILMTIGSLLRTNFFKKKLSISQQELDLFKNGK